MSSVFIWTASLLCRHVQSCREEDFSNFSLDLMSGSSVRYLKVSGASLIYSDCDHLILTPMILEMGCMSVYCECYCYTWQRVITITMITMFNNGSLTPFGLHWGKHFQQERLDDDLQHFSDGVLENFFVPSLSHYQVILLNSFTSNTI